MPRFLRRSTLLLALGASAGLSTFLWRRLAPPPTFVVTESDVIEEVAAERRSASEPAARPYALSEEHARKLFTFRGGKVYDPWTYYREQPFRHVRVPWPEHPDGAFTVETNSLGFRDDELGPPADFEVLVVGDSNTAGVCNQEESYANRLEALLRAARPNETVSVVNLGTGGYGFHNDLGAVEQHVEREPDAFVVAIFGGNDFSELLPLHRVFDGGPAQAWTGDVGARRAEALESDLLLMTHCYNSALLFKTFPDRADVAVEVGARLAGAMKSACDRRGVRLIVLYIPEPCRFEWSPPLERAADVRERLGLEPADCESSSRIADRFLEELGRLPVEVVDLRPVFAALPAPPYWRKDLHMNLEAHELAARALLELLK